MSTTSALFPIYRNVTLNQLISGYRAESSSAVAATEPARACLLPAE